MGRGPVQGSPWAPRTCPWWVLQLRKCPRWKKFHQGPPPTRLADRALPPPYPRGRPRPSPPTPPLYPLPPSGQSLDSQGSIKTANNFMVVPIKYPVFCCKFQPKSTWWTLQQSLRHSLLWQKELGICSAERLRRTCASRTHIRRLNACVCTLALRTGIFTPREAWSSPPSPSSSSSSSSSSSPSARLPWPRQQASPPAARPRPLLGPVRRHRHLHRRRHRHLLRPRRRRRRRLRRRLRPLRPPVPPPTPLLVLPLLLPLQLPLPLLLPLLLPLPRRQPRLPPPQAAAAAALLVSGCTQAVGKRNM